MKSTIAGFVIVLCAASWSVNAQPLDRPGYIGIGLGTAALDGSDIFRDAGLQTDSSVFAGNIYGGYRFHPAFAVEIGYVATGNGKIRGSEIEIGGVEVNIDAEHKLSTIYGAVAGRLANESRITPFAKLGVHRWSGKVGGTVSNLPATRELSATLDNSDTDVMYGAGVDVRLTDRWDIRAEWQNFSTAGEDGNIFTIGVKGNF